MLEVDELKAWYGRTQALFGVNFSLVRGRCLALVGTNGAGKTTVIRSVLGLVPTAGSIKLNGEEVSRLPTPKRVRRHKMSVIHEGRGLFKHLSVRENILVGLRQQSGDRLDEAVELFPALRDRLHEPVSLLSGGQQQMVALARSVAHQPDLLLLDEPSLGLAPGIVEEIYGYLNDLRRAGLTMLLVEQSIARAKDFADELCLLKTGRTVMTVGAGDDEQVNQLVSNAFDEERQ